MENERSVQVEFSTGIRMAFVPVTGPVVAQSVGVGRGIALLFHDHGTRRGWVVICTPRPYFTPGKDTVPIVQEAGWAPEPVWTGGKSRPIGILSPDRPARSQSLYRLSYRAHFAGYKYEELLIKQGQLQCCLNCGFNLQTTTL